MFYSFWEPCHNSSDLACSGDPIPKVVIWHLVVNRVIFDLVKYGSEMCFNIEKI